MDPIFNLTLPPHGSRELASSLHRALRSAILDGRLHAGLRLPATRTLAESLKVSRNTVVAAYDLLLSEGYLEGRPGAGTYVAQLAQLHPSPEAGTRRAPRDELPIATGTAPPLSYDFRLGTPDVSQLPFDIWQRLSARVTRQYAAAPLGYASPEGCPELRQAIARHVSFARAVACRAEDIVVTSGAQQAFDLLARTLVTPGVTRVAIEDPCYPPLRAALLAAGALLAPVPCDDEGLIVVAIPPDARVVCVTPSHQFPLGVVMSPQRRAALLAFARANDAVVIEDDYDSEFRYGGRGLDALQTLDASGAVFYVGTFSKSLFPALRLGYVVAPPWARRSLADMKKNADWHAPLLAQRTLAAFIDEGHLARHIRKMRKVYAGRRNALLRALATHGGDKLEVIPSAAGLHLSIRLRQGDSAALAAAAAAGIGVEPLERYCADREHGALHSGLCLSFALMDESEFDTAIASLFYIF